MQGKLPEQVDPKRLAHQGAALTGQIPPAELQRLGSAFELQGSADVDLAVHWSERHRPRIHGRVSIPIASICQRCLQTYETLLEARVDVEVGELPRDTEQDFEVLLDPGAALKLREFVEDELLLEAPMIPLHERGDCHAPDGADDAPASEGRPQRKAFSELRKLWDRDGK